MSFTWQFSFWTAILSDYGLMGAFAKLRKAIVTIVVSVCPFVCPYVRLSSRNNSATTRRIFMKCDLLIYLLSCLFIYLLTYLLTSWSRVLLEKLTGSAASQEIPCLLWNRKFITAFTSACHLSLSWATSIQSIPTHPTSWKSSLILSSHLRLFMCDYFSKTCRPKSRFIYIW